MLTIAQIYAVLALLLAFGVPQSTVNNVQAILEASTSQSVAPISSSSANQTIQPAQTFGSVVPQDCTPTLQASIVKVDGTVATGIDYQFIGTSTFPSDCTPVALPVSLQTPTVKYTGDTAFGDGKNIYVYHQGWGVGRGIQPTGNFTWTVGSASTTTEPVENL